MPAADARLERDLAGFVRDVERALGTALVGVSVYGSAATGEWIRARSDVNTLIVVNGVTTGVLDALAARLPSWRRRGFALPLLVDEEFLERARDAFPMELDDARRAHRTLVGPDVLADVQVDRAQLRRQCEHEARAKLLRLRALYLDTAADPAALEQLLAQSLTTFLVILRHVVHLRGDDAPFAYADVLAHGERLLGPLPAFRRVLDHRRGGTRLTRRELRTEFTRYLADAERVVAAVDALHA
jgi:predicted nucleotidyltransferase